MIGPEEDDDFSEETLREYINEEHIERTRGQATEDNNKMKLLWKELFDIDIDALDIDFKKYNMHICPQVNREEEYFYFNYVPDGVVEWVMQGINFPDGKCTFDAVSALMEFVALIELEERIDSEVLQI